MASKRRHICLVDDEVDFRSVFALEFEVETDEGRLKVSTCNFGKDCLELLNGEAGSDVTLVISDINMPTMDGFELLFQIKESRSEVIVFICSAYETMDHISKARSLGASHFFSKPLDFDELRIVMGKSLGIAL
jgi:DNA-binding NtrC family response regulator